MNWDDLRFVLAVIREGTLNRAATSLAVARPTVGRRLRGIEEELGVRLFDRTPDGFIPTPAGEEIGEVAERVEGDVLGIEGRVRGRDAELRGKLVVTTLGVVFRGHHDLFSSFLTRYPDVALTVSTGLDEVSLTRREADVALRMSNAPAEYLVGRKVGWVAFAPYASEALAQRMGPDAVLRDYPWLHWDERSNPRWLDRWLAHNAPGARIAMRIDSAVAMRDAVSASIGVHLLPCFDGDADPGLRRVGPLDPTVGRELWLLAMPDVRNTLRVRAFMDHMHEGLRKRSGELAGNP